MALLGVFGVGGAAQAASPAVAFPDAALKACVLTALDDPGPEVALAQLQTLTELACPQRGIASVTGLGQASALKTLDLSGNELTDAGPLAGLGRLESLTLSYNSLQSISVIAGLGALVNVDASYNSIQSLGDLSGLGSLGRLVLNHNSIASAAGFAGGGALRQVDLSFNLLADASFASRLTQLTDLNLSNNRLSSAVPFGSLAAEVDLTNQSLSLPAIPVGTLQALPVARSASLDPLPLRLTAESQAYGYESPGGFTWRSNGVGQLFWAESLTRPAGNTLAFSGRFTQVVTRGTLTAPTPIVSGSAIYLQTLTASPGSWGPAPVALSYQWKRDGVPIGGATTSTYTLASADVGTKVSVAVTGTKASYATATVESAQTTAVAGLVLTATPVPTISGTAKVSQTLTANSGAWAPATVNLAYQWLGGGVAIAGATASTYTVKNADAGSTITVRVTGTKAGYTTASKTSAATAPVTGGVIAPGTPTILGSVALGKVLTAVPGTWTPAPVSYTYQWNRDGVAITGAVGATHTVPAADLGKAITVTVTGSRSGFTPVSATSAKAGIPK
ncbi:hypothetical protein B7R21_02540 [Subtercola boreus]|uniref:Ig-like domain-containing protein n=1 Tax=Subtercola boreus TaxID=120213 RepID=A0A3E0W291_9MICO|nr:leucine-rich repeat domain-containing protein [Subtercola boreus]RFA16276.1 hypothetical protein B7R21_02540 [Subtercola boreus]